MAGRPRAFAAAASVFVVSLAGLQLQYLNAADFAGKLGDWLGLLLWTGMVELGSVSVLDILGRWEPRTCAVVAPHALALPKPRMARVDENALRFVGSTELITHLCNLALSMRAPQLVGFKESLAYSGTTANDSTTELR